MECRPAEALGTPETRNDLEAGKWAMRRERYLSQLLGDVMYLTGSRGSWGEEWFDEVQQERQRLLAEADLALLAHRGRL
jgi:hypothetical protein